jgi:RNA polymerase sigma factor (sigma-70 family)
MKTIAAFNDQELVQQFMAGNADALEILVKRHQSKIYTSIYLLVKDKYTAEDIFQEVFIRIIKKLKAGQYREENKFLYWAMRIGHNLCVDHFRRIKSGPVIHTGNGEDIFEALHFEEENAETKRIDLETKDMLCELIDRLPNEQREVIILRHYADLRFKDIANMLGCPVNTALGRMRYGLLNLRKMMREVA